jgi:hypothetical protein
MEAAQQQLQQLVGFGYSSSFCNSVGVCGRAMVRLVELWSAWRLAHSWDAALQQQVEVWCTWRLAHGMEAVRKLVHTVVVLDAPQCRSTLPQHALPMLGRSQSWEAAGKLVDPEVIWGGTQCRSTLPHHALQMLWKTHLVEATRKLVDPGAVWPGKQCTEAAGQLAHPVLHRE